MRVDLLTREYPPHVYGGAGVHVTELAKVLRSRVDELRIHAFDGPREDAGEVIGYSDLPELAHANPALRTLGVDIAIAADTVGADLVHSHTWYANFAGHLSSLMNDIPHVVTACARGRPSSSVGGTASPLSLSVLPTRLRQVLLQFHTECARTFCAPIPPWIPTAFMSSITELI